MHVSCCTFVLLLAKALNRGEPGKLRTWMMERGSRRKVGVYPVVLRKFLLCVPVFARVVLRRGIAVGVKGVVGKNRNSFAIVQLCSTIAQRNSCASTPWKTRGTAWQPALYGNLCVCVCVCAPRYVAETFAVCPIIPSLSNHCTHELMCFFFKLFRGLQLQLK